MASGSSVVIDLEFDFDASAGNRSTSELISALKSCFRESDFARVESILIQREEKLKEELETLERVNEWLMYQRESSGMENMKVQKRCEELQHLNTKLIQEKNEILERERRAVDVAELWEKKYEGLRSRILKLEGYVKLFASNLEPNARVSSENGNYAEGENGTGNANAIEGSVDLVGANVDRSTEDSRGPPSRSIVQLSDSDDDSVSGEILSRNGQTSHGVAESDCPSQMYVHCRTRLLKRKQDSCTNVSENKNCKSECVEDADADFHGTSLTADCKVAKSQKLIDGNDGSLVNRCSEMAVSSRSNNAEKICPLSSQEAWILRQCEEKMGSECISKNLTRESFLNVPAVCNIDDSSSSSSSSSSSESDVDLDFDFPQLTRIINDKKWESESDMFAAFEKENELYLKAVCALYRHQTAVEKLPSSSASSNNRGVNQFNSLRGSTLAKFLIDGNRQGNLKKSVSELLQYDPKGLDDCKKIVSDHSKQLFEIYQKKEDPLFMS